MITLDAKLRMLEHLQGCITDGCQHKRQYNSKNNLDASEVYFVFQTYTDHTTPRKKMRILSWSEIYFFHFLKTQN